MSDISEARKVVLPTFVLTETCSRNDLGSIQYKIKNSLVDNTYYYRPVSYRSDNYCFNLLPVVVDGTGAPWVEANLYILSRIEGASSPSMATYSGIADDLAAYKRFLEEDELDFTDFPKHRLSRPTYLYRSSIIIRIRAGETSLSTARRRIASVIGFYRWLISSSRLILKYPPWEDGEVFIRFRDSKGFGVIKKVSTTNIAIKIAKQNDPYAGTIDDGAKLRPLPPEEQKLVIDALLDIGNTEMTLIHLLALFSGARIQTVLTFCARHVRLELPDDLLEVPIPVGPGTNIDMKFDKRMVLFIPRWLYEKLRIYSFSARAIKRREKSGGDNEDQYLFLSNRGKPFYTSKLDRSKFNESLIVRHEKNGQTVRQFIADRVRPWIESKTGKLFHYRLHDLRASFGMNLTDRQLALVQSGEVTLHQAREFVKTRMGHESSATTDLYLNFRSNLKFVKRVQAEYEGHLKLLADLAKKVAV